MHASHERYLIEERNHNKKYVCTYRDNVLRSARGSCLKSCLGPGLPKKSPIAQAMHLKSEAWLALRNTSHYMRYIWGIRCIWTIFNLHIRGHVPPLTNFVFKKNEGSLWLWDLKSPFLKVKTITALFFFKLRLLQPSLTH